MEKRKMDEISFHNQREIDRNSMPEKEFYQKYPNKRFYFTVEKSRNFVNSWIANNCNGRINLDYCCGLGSTSLVIAKTGGTVYGIDISSESIDTAKKRLAEDGYVKNAHFKVMDAEKTDFPDRFFDIIICSGVLHHLDLDKAYKELSRILKADGKILCHESLGYNPIIAMYRKKTLNLRTEWESEHILTVKDVNMAKKYFSKTTIKYFHLASIIAIPFYGRKIFKPLLASLNFVDFIIMKIPFIQKLAWQMVFELSVPRNK